MRADFGLNLLIMRRRTVVSIEAITVMLAAAIPAHCPMHLKAFFTVVAAHS
jgi:hypothetical protein